MAELPKEKIWEVLLVRRLNGIQKPPADTLKNWKLHLTLLTKHAHGLKIYFVKNFLFHMLCARQWLMLGN